jgi:hypothetical protein
MSEHFRYRNDVFQSDIFVSDIGITDVDVGYRISPTLRSMSMPTYANYTVPLLEPMLSPVFSLPREAVRSSLLVKSQLTQPSQPSPTITSHNPATHNSPFVTVYGTAVRTHGKQPRQCGFGSSTRSSLTHKYFFLSL